MTISDEYELDDGSFMVTLTGDMALTWKPSDIPGIWALEGSYTRVPNPNDDE